MRKFINERITNKMRSDKGAALSVEMIIILALAVFAGLALFTFILTPVQNTADGMGQGIQKWVGDLVENNGDNSPQFEFPVGERDPR